MVSGNRLDDCAAILACIGDTKTSPIELADSQQKAVLSAWWSLVNAFWKKFGPDPIRDDKKAFCETVVLLLVNLFSEKLVDLDRIAEVTAMERIENAFAVAQQKFQVARLLQVRGWSHFELFVTVFIVFSFIIHNSILSLLLRESAAPE
ncbi:unnamed protein product [Nippostrongylus brasiliensis]|uniref:FRIGIDA-like protein n=1 Tax=Nippostrongylus brasiliensis TaxID=27835 RepID=A0A0N4YIH8_NIPBR|nr:unnamed protein product [Nippostrongylus brasiliensis]